jgi:hypothetical protein
MTAEPTQLSLWLDTIRQLRPSQIAHRGRLRAQSLLWENLRVSPAAVVRRRANSQLPGWPANFVPLDLHATQASESPQLNAKGWFEFLNERRHLGEPADWDQPDASRLWRYHLHYFEWTWAFIADGDRAWATGAWRKLWSSWKADTRFARGTAWSPYVASLRTWVLCGAYSAFAADRPLARDLKTSVAEHAGYVRSHLEFDVGGNHLLKNLKALIGAAVFLGDDDLLWFGVAKLRAEIAVQVLDDGGHYERSPSYHCQVLGDLIDIERLFFAAEGRQIEGLSNAITKMRAWLGSMLLPDGDVPFFNDSATVGPRKIECLEPHASPRTATKVLSSSGYVVAGDRNGVFIVIDVGPPCPRELPAHAHSDCLSFELCVDGRRVIVNSGTSTYEPGPRRNYERSTRAHNTLEIEDKDQTETWGTFRAARRANALLERLRIAPDSVEVVGSHDGYTRLPGAPVHRRTWTISRDEVRIVDEVTGDGRMAISSWIHVSDDKLKWGPGIGVLRTAAVEILVEGSGVVCELIDAGTEPEGWIASGFGRRFPAPAVLAHADGPLPVRLTTAIKTTARMPTFYA